MCIELKEAWEAIHHFLRRSIPAFLATASRPFFSMVLRAFVDSRSLRYRLPASHHTLLYCKLTNWSFLVLWLENETLFARFAFFPVNGHIRPATSVDNGTIKSYICSGLMRQFFPIPPTMQLNNLNFELCLQNNRNQQKVPIFFPKQTKMQLNIG